VADLQIKIPLRELLDRAIAGDYTRQQLAELHRLSFVLGRGYVRLRCARTRLPLTLFGLDEADVVHDGIADLFTRAASGRLVEFARYFEHHGIVPSSLPDDMLVVHLRNLVFTNVSDSLFRMLNESDPSLGKIIRNIKLAVRDSRRWSLETRFDDKVLILALNGLTGGTSPSALLREDPIPEEQLEQIVHGIIARHPDVPSLLAGLAGEFDRTGIRPGPVPIVCLAVMVKVGFEKVHVHTESVEGPPGLLQTEDVGFLIARCCSSVAREMRSKYVGKGKVCAERFEQYISALEAYYRGQCLPVPGGAGSMTYYEALREALPALTKDEYADDHRPTFEYLGKLVKQHLRERLGSE
jgi:hypothetical protein